MKREFELLDELSKLADARLKGNITDGYVYGKPAKKAVPHIVGIHNVIFNDPATIVLWTDGTKTVVKCQEGDVFDPEKGLAMAISKKAFGNKSSFNNTFKKWLPKPEKLELDIRCTNNATEAIANLKKAFDRFL